MDSNNLGKILQNTRREYDYISDDVFVGICSRTAYYDYENGVSLPEKYMFDALLQRMGKSSDQFEAVLSEEEYEWILDKEELERLIIEKQYDEAEKLWKKKKIANERMKDEDAEKVFRKQYLMYIEGILLFRRKRYRKSRRVLQEAYLITGSGKLLTLQEYHILLMSTRISTMAEEKKFQLYLKLYEHCKKYVTDSREQVKLLPKTVLCMAEDLVARKKWEQVYEYTLEGMALLSKEGEILCFRELLYYYRMACEHIKPEDVQEVTWIIEALEGLYREFNYPLMDTVECIIKKSIRTEYYLLSEHFRNHRRLLGLTQENMEDKEIGTDRHIRRIESGKVRPYDSTVQKLNNLVDNQKSRITGYLNAVDFKILEHNARCAAAMSRKDYVTAEKEVEWMEANSDSIFKQYRQSMERRRLFLSAMKKEISQETCLERYKELLELTQPGFKWENISKLQLNRSEVEILNAIAMASKNLNNTKMAKHIWESIIEHFDNSKIENKHSNTTIILPLLNLARTAEEEGEFEKAIYYCQSGIILVLASSWGNALQQFLTQLAYTYERMGEQNKEKTTEEICQYYLAGAYVAKIMGDEYLYNFTQKHLATNGFLDSRHHQNHKSE